MKLATQIAHSFADAPGEIIEDVLGLAALCVCVIAGFTASGLA